MLIIYLLILYISLKFYFVSVGLLTLEDNFINTGREYLRHATEVGLYSSERTPSSLAS